MFLINAFALIVIILCRNQRKARYHNTRYSHEIDHDLVEKAVVNGDMEMQG
jgi:hypothetical protein